MGDFRPIWPQHQRHPRRQRPHRVAADRGARDVIPDPVSGAPCLPRCRRARERLRPLRYLQRGAAPTAAQRDWMMATRRKHREQTQKIFGANIAGSPFSLPAGDIQAVIGVEHRRESIHNVDDNGAAPPEKELSHLGAWAPYEPELRASNHVSEAYGELVVPLLRDMPFIHSLTVEGAYRYSDYSDFESTHTWKIGGTWMPFSELTLRAVRVAQRTRPQFRRTLFVARGAGDRRTRRLPADKLPGQSNANGELRDVDAATGDSDALSAERDRHRLCRHRRQRRCDTRNVEQPDARSGFPAALPFPAST